MALVDTITGYTHVNILVTDLEAAHDFYIEKLGFSVLPRPDFGGFQGEWYRVGNLQLHLSVVKEMPDLKGGFPHLAVYVPSASFDDTVALLKQRGVPFLGETMEREDFGVPVKAAFCKDPDSIDDNEVWAALEAAQFSEFAAQMPYGLYTMCGEDGVKLSGGQRQRLALARAFYRKAKLMVLDEATSALDNKTEHDVMQALDLIGRRCTMVVIAHRLSTVKKCDRIFEISQGRVVASGNFETLTQLSPSFREMTMLDAV